MICNFVFLVQNMIPSQKKFIPFHEIKTRDVIVVDGLHPNNLVLSHWKGANIHKQIAADTSGEIVLNALKLNFPGINTPLISATHFDIDGFVGVFALFYPELAIEHYEVLKQMAIIGDFREYNSSEAAEKALKLCCWMNTIEKDKFYRPFGEKEEIKACVEKFNYFLPLFPSVLANPAKYKKDWKRAYDEVIHGLKQLKSTSLDYKYPKLGLFIRKTTEPIHYYALFSATDNFDIVLSCYTNNRYELEYKYTTWVDIASRKTLPRIDLQALATMLNKIELSNYSWEVDKISDTGPIMRLEKDKISKADRYANPTERNIYASSIPEEDFQRHIINFFSLSYEAIKPKKNWTWKEMKHFKPFS